MGLFDFKNLFAPALLGGLTLATGGAAAPLEGAALAGEGAGALGEGSAALPAQHLAEATAPIMPAPTPLGAPPGLPETPISPGLPDTTGWDAMGDSLDAQHAEHPTTPTTPTDWMSKLKGAHQAISFARQIVPGTAAKQMLGVMEMGTGMGANLDDPMAALKAAGEPLKDLSQDAQKKQDQQLQDQRLSQALAAKNAVPSSAQRPAAAPITNASPATARAAAGFMPSTRLTGDTSMAGPEERLRMLRGF